MVEYCLVSCHLGVERTTSKGEKLSGGSKGVGQFGLSLGFAPKGLFVLLPPLTLLGTMCGAMYVFPRD